MGVIPLLAASSGESLPFLERNEIACSMERGLLSWDMCLTLIVKTLEKSPLLEHTHVILPSIHLSILLFIHSCRCWPIG